MPLFFTGTPSCGGKLQNCPRRRLSGLSLSAKHSMCMFSCLCAWRSAFCPVGPLDPMAAKLRSPNIKTGGTTAVNGGLQTPSVLETGKI